MGMLDRRRVKCLVSDESEVCELRMGVSCLCSWVLGTVGSV